MQFDNQKIELILDGQFNPAIHTQAWYEKNNLLPENSDVSSFLVTGTSKIKFSGIEINCGYESWRISTILQDDFPFMVKLADKVFHSLLGHTPISGGKISVTHRHVDDTESLSQSVKSKILRSGMAPMFDIGALQWSRQGSASEFGGFSMFWLCDDNTHFHSSHEYIFELSEANGESDSSSKISDKLLKSNDIFAEACSLTTEIITAFGESDGT